MRTAVVWGNCQAGPVADLLRLPLADAGVEVIRVPPVYLVDAEDLAEVHRAVSHAAVLVSQPIREEYTLPGCGTRYLASLMPDGSRVVTFPVAFHVGAFPYQVHGHGAAGERVDAPLTDYHDLRALVAAARGLSVDEAARWWPQPAPAAVQAVADRSSSELRRREAALDVAVSDLLDEPAALWTMTHPANQVLVEVARRVLRALDLPGHVVSPSVEYLGERRAPVEPAVAAAFDWPDSATRTSWLVGGVELPLTEMLAAQLAFYAERPDVVHHSLDRQGDRLAALELSV